jgi:flavin reductase (DIM6/NTAB) family NADH-FMN oxidoreductase RutF
MKQQEPVTADSGWKETTIRSFHGSPSERIGSGWMLISAGDAGPSGWNTMTASWGGLGVLWGRDVAFMFIRPSRFTYHFANTSPLFTLSFFDESYREALNICGAKSGRDIDKAAEAGLSPIAFGPSYGRAAGAIGFKEAQEIIVCRKLYTHDFDPAQFIERPSIERPPIGGSSIEANYQGRDYHRMFIGEIVSLLVKS